MSDLRPTAAQLGWQQLELGMFVHVGVNTFAGCEWSDGTLPAASFAPTELDAGQWAAVAQQMGARYLVLTAKHHDGFCLWPTATTDYSVASSPWRGGRGDLVGEVADACRAAGLAFGVYLSPWDRHEPRYPDAPAYDAFYTAQLRELCTRYGRLGEIWFDGAGSAGRVYDWDAIMTVVEGDPARRHGVQHGSADDPLGRQGGAGRRPSPLRHRPHGPEQRRRRRDRAGPAAVPAARVRRLAAARLVLVGRGRAEVPGPPAGDPRPLDRSRRQPAARRAAGHPRAGARRRRDPAARVAGRARPPLRPAGGGRAGAGGRAR